MLEKLAYAYDEGYDENLALNTTESLKQVDVCLFRLLFCFIGLHTMSWRKTGKYNLSYFFTLILRMIVLP